MTDDEFRAQVLDKLTNIVIVLALVFFVLAINLPAVACVIGEAARKLP